MNELANAAAGLDVLRQALNSVGSDQLGYRTPCRDYDVAALATHVVDSIRRISVAAGVVVPESEDADLVRRVVDTGGNILGGWRHRGVDGDVSFGGRMLPARDLLGVIALEFVVHGWDFATAVGQTVMVPDTLAADILVLAGRTLTAESRRFAGFDEPVAVADAARPLDRLLAFTGRCPAPLLR